MRKYRPYQHPSQPDSLFLSCAAIFLMIVYIVLWLGLILAGIGVLVGWWGPWA